METPNNEGAYKDIFSLAAKKIGCTLSITRLPKKRLHKYLKEGSVDFYPGASFSLKRSEYLYYLPNSLPEGEYGVTASDVAEINNIQQVKTLNLEWLMEPASSKLALANKYEITTKHLKYINLDIVEKHIKRSRPVFYVADKVVLDLYINKHQLPSYEAMDMRVHYNCCGGTYPMYLGFSRFSKHYHEEDNLNYDAKLPISPNNFPKQVTNDTVVYRLAQALNEMIKNGTTLRIYNTWLEKIHVSN